MDISGQDSIAVIRDLLTRADPNLDEAQRESVWDDFNCGEEFIALERTVGFLFENRSAIPYALVKDIQTCLATVGSSYARNLERLAADR